jgi:hypothetical protein
MLPTKLAKESEMVSDPFFRPDIPGADLPDEIFFIQNIVFKQRNTGTDIKDFMSVAATGSGYPQFFHRLPDLAQGPVTMIGMTQLDGVNR